MRQRLGPRLVCLLALVWLSTVAWASDPAGKSKEPPAKAKEPAAKVVCPVPKDANKGKKAATKVVCPVPKNAGESAVVPPATQTVKKGPWKIIVDLEGVFEAQKDHEIVVKLDEWNSLVVLSAVEHGARVRQGDVLLTLETDKINRAIADIRTELKLAEISIKQGEDQLQALEKGTPLDLEASKRTARMAEEDRKFLLDIERPFAVKATEFGLKMAKESLEYEQEELRQLEKMYKANDITEETEQIVLKRARDGVERAKFMVEATQLNHDQVLKFTIPRVEELVNESARRKALDFEKNKVELPLTLQKQRLELEKLRVQRERADDKLKKLLGDREAMTVKSPADGIVYYGKCTRGKFSDSSHLAESLRPDAIVQPN
jgi:HlyD family secretion protein